MVPKFPHQITSYAILMFEKGNDSVAFFLHCLGGPARTGHPGRCRARRSAHLRTPTLRHRRSPPAAEGPEKFSNSPGLTQKWLGRRGRSPPGPSLRPRGQSEKSPEKAPRPRQTCSLQSCCPGPRTSGGQGATRPKSGAPRRHEGRGSAPRLRDGARRPAGSRSLLLIRPTTTRQRRSATHPPAGQSRTAEAWRPSVRSRCPRPDTQPQTCSLSRPRERLGTRKAGCGPAGGAEGRGCGASPRPATHRGYGLDPAAAEPSAAPWKWGAGGRLPPRGGGAPGRPGHCGRTHRSREPSVSAGPRPLRGRPAPSRAGPAGRKQRTSGLQNVPAWGCSYLRGTRDLGKATGLVLQTAGPEATFGHKDARHPRTRARGGAWAKRAELRGRVALGRTAGPWHLFVPQGEGGRAAGNCSFRRRPLVTCAGRSGGAEGPDERKHSDHSDFFQLPGWQGLARPFPGLGKLPRPQLSLIRA